MFSALLLVAAAPQSAVEAERAFAADAKAIGQWTAFRKWAADDAIFLPPQRVADALKDAPDPPVAVDWWPTASFTSCDGATAANTGGALWPGGRSSYFSTIWQRQPGGAWRWRLDHGADLSSPRARVAQPALRRASCRRTPTLDDAGADGGASADGTLRWRWTVAPGGGHSFAVQMWTGGSYETVIDDRVPAPPAKVTRP
ncbi:hypothetical protein [Sphingomonas sp. TZW2008]|uniref:hypothetical protein n=1 Tax=Sphingomonas sp. TZW2008 TaxID=1917973 RepID=UPI000A26D98E|nr:hypothetical protein [Sphingomonas sp. TZW2008]